MAVILLGGRFGISADEAADAEARRPDRFAIVFNMGYAGDHLPQDPASFDRLIAGLRKAHFNVVLCKYTPWRAKICRKYGVEIFVDLLAPGHHVYKEVDGAKKLCESLRGSRDIYGYHLWSDRIGNSYPGRSRDAKNVREWDPTHPIYVGTYQMSRVNRVEGIDLLGYYDFHWKRGGHWRHLARASDVARGKKAAFLRYCDPAPGQMGIGNVNRVAYTIATSIPFGLKGYTFHYRGGVVDPKTGKLDKLGGDLQKTNAVFEAVGKELMKIGNPTAVYSTKVTRSNKDRPIDGEPAVPGGLTPIPADHTVQVLGGEVLVGFFRDEKNNEVATFASHNAYQPQRVTIELKHKVKSVKLFDPARKKWKRLSPKKQRFQLDVEVSSISLLRIEK